MIQTRQERPQENADKTKETRKEPNAAGEPHAYRTDKREFDDSYAGESKVIGD